MRYLIRSFLVGVLFVFCFQIFNFLPFSSVYVSAQENTQNNTQNTSGQNAANEKENVCFSPSEGFLEFKHFIADVITVVQNRKRKTTSEKYTIGNTGIIPPGVFRQNILHYSEVGINMLLRFTAPKLKKTGEEAVNMVASTAVVSFFMARDALIKNSWGGVTTSLQNRAIQREYYTLQDMDFEIQKLIFDLANEGKWTFDKRVANETVAELNSVLQKYPAQGRMFQQIIVNQDLTYPELMTKLLNLTSWFRQFLARPRPWSNGNAVRKFIEKKQYGQKSQNKDHIIVLFNQTGVEKFGKAYIDTHSCSTALKDFWKSIKSTKGITKDIHTSWKEIKKEIKDASKRLGQAGKSLGAHTANTFSNENKEISDILSDNQIEILREVYGIDAGKMIKGQAIGLADLFKTSKTEDTPGQTTQQQGKKNKKKNKNNNKKKDEKDKNKEEEETDEEENKKENRKNIKERIHSLNKNDPKAKETLHFSQKINTILENTSALHKKANTAHVESTNHNITRKFKEIGYLLKEIQDIIEDNEKNLVNTCKYQCKNKGTRSCKN